MTGILHAMLAAAPPSSPPVDFVLFNTSTDIQGYTFDGINFATKGNASPGLIFPLPTADRSSVTGLASDKCLIAGNDATNAFRMARFDFDGSDWNRVGNEFQITSGNFSFPAVAAMDLDNVALITQVGLFTYRFDGSDWAQEGNSSPIGNARSSASISATRFIRAHSMSMTIYDWDGLDWTSFANQNFGTTFEAICSLTTTLYAAYERTNNVLKTYELVGTTISQVGNALSVNVATKASLCSLSPTRIVFGAVTDSELQAYDWDGSDWALVGTPLSVSIPEFNNLASTNYLLI